MCFILLCAKNFGQSCHYPGKGNPHGAGMKVAHYCRGPADGRIVGQDSSRKIISLRHILLHYFVINIQIRIKATPEPMSA
jgi:hypothetical protein